jgi:hypothetical protein
MVTTNDVDCELNDFSHVKIHRHQTSIEITVEKDDDEATNASSHRCKVLIFIFFFLFFSLIRSFVLIVLSPRSIVTNQRNIDLKSNEIFDALKTSNNKS